MEYRKLLDGITPSMIVSLGAEASVAKLEQLNLPLSAAIGLTYACLVYERSKWSQLICGQISMNDSLNLLYCLLDLELAKQQTTEEKPNSKVFIPLFTVFY